MRAPTSHAGKGACAREGADTKAKRRGGDGDGAEGAHSGGEEGGGAGGFGKGGGDEGGGEGGFGKGGGETLGNGSGEGGDAIYSGPDGLSFSGTDSAGYSYSFDAS